MTARNTVRSIWLALILASVSLPTAAAEEFTDAIHAYLQHCVETDRINRGFVVGLVDERGSRIVSYGKMDNGTDQEVNGDTVFEIGSVTKTFTTLLLQDMIERGEMKLDDPVARYLPASVTMPARKGKEITLLHLATHTSGLPCWANNYDSKRVDNPFIDYTVERLYAFLSGCKLTRDPGAEWGYSNLGMELLGHVIALKAGTSYESLLVERICRPLKMDSTRVTLTPELNARFATGHNELGYAVSRYDYILAGSGAIRSTANDLLKYVAANLGLTRSGLTPLMEKTHAARVRMSPDTEVGLAWWVGHNAEGNTIVSHGGLTGGFRAYVGFDKARRHGVVVLSNFGTRVSPIGELLLESQWQADRRPTATTFSSQACTAYVGQYRRSPGTSLEMPGTQRFLPSVPAALIHIAACSCIVALIAIFWRTGNRDRRRIILGGTVLVVGLWMALIVPAQSRGAGAASQPGIGIRLEANRVFLTATEPVPPPDVELLPGPEACVFERVTGRPVTFSRDGAGRVTSVTLHHFSQPISYEKVSDQPPKAPEPVKPRAFVKLDAKLLDAYVGRYEFAPDALSPLGVKMSVWREGEQLLLQAWGKNGTYGATEIHAVSETKFFDIDNGAEVTFIGDKEGNVTSMVTHCELLDFDGNFGARPDYEGKKVK